MIYEYSLRFLTRRGFPYLNELNRFIELANMGGLIEKWHSDSTRSLKDSSSHNQLSYRPLNLINLRGILIICSILAMPPFIVLILEYFVHKNATAKNPSRRWLMLQLIIDADRHFFLDKKMN